MVWFLVKQSNEVLLSESKTALFGAVFVFCNKDNQCAFVFFPYFAGVIHTVDSLSDSAFDLYNYL